MNTISSNSYLNSLTLEHRQKVQAEKEKQEREERGSNQLGQTAFLELMITQMEHQDPLSPQENTEFIAQLAQFSSVEGMERLNRSFDGFSANFRSNQALEASSLVGRSVTVPTDEAQLRENSYVGGSVTLPNATTDIKLNINTEQGTLLHSIALGNQPAGELIFRWDGRRLEVNGELTNFVAEETAEPGAYKFEVLAVLPDEDANGALTPQQLDTALTANVNSVTTTTNGELILNLSGLGAVNINQVKQFN